MLQAALYLYPYNFLAETWKVLFVCYSGLTTIRYSPDTWIWHEYGMNMQVLNITPAEIKVLNKRLVEVVLLVSKLTNAKRS